MRARGWLLPLLALAGCGGGSFLCSDDAQCTRDGVTGTCEAGGCAFPDEACPSGKRYGALSGSLAGQCVDPSEGSGGATSPGDGGGTHSGESSTSGASTGEGTVAVSAGSSTGSPGDSTGGATSSEGDDGSDTGVRGDVVHNYVFVSSLSEAAEALGGLTGADGLCQSAADAAGLPGAYVAWLSTPTVDARDRVAEAQGWARLDGRPFALSVAAIVAGDLLYPIRLDEDGVDRFSTGVTTATGSDGTYGGPGNCGGFAGGDGEVRRGSSDGLANTHSQAYNADCDEQARLYCFGVDDAVSIPVAPEPTARRAFVTSSEIAGDAGLAAFDALCQSDAEDAGLDGTFLALVATSTTAATGRFDLGGEPWSLVNDTLVVASAADLADPSALLLAPVVRLADGTPDGSGQVWTGSPAPATPAAAANCSDWTASTGSATTGQRARTAGWWNLFSRACSDTRRLVCLQE